MNVLYIGDIYGEPGIKVVQEFLPMLRKELAVDLVIAQAENVSEGRSITIKDMLRLENIGVDFFTGGNHTPKRKEIHHLLEDNKQPIIGPANMKGCPGKGWKYAQTSSGPVLIISILGDIFSNNQKPEIDNPLQKVDEILKQNEGQQHVATIVDFHGDFSSQKRIIGYYLDGRVTAVLGDHWHVPTADAMILPKGTAHMTDVGMCGTLHSSLGVKLDAVIPRWRDGIVNHNEMEEAEPFQFNGALIETDTQTGLAQKIIPIQKLTMP